MLRGLCVHLTRLSTDVMQSLCQKIYYCYFSIVYEIYSLNICSLEPVTRPHYRAAHQYGACLCAVPGRKNGLDFGRLTITRKGKLMALKVPPPPWELLQQVSELVGASGVKSDVDKSLRALAQSTLSRLDMVSREEFDAQTEILQRTRARVILLEATLEEMTQELEHLTQK